jgi:hypothetical protein
VPQITPSVWACGSSSSKNRAPIRSKVTFFVNFNDRIVTFGKRSAMWSHTPHAPVFPHEQSMFDSNRNDYIAADSAQTW